MGLKWVSKKEFYSKPSIFKTMTMWLQGSRVFVHIHVYTPAERRCDHMLHYFFIMSPWQRASQSWKLWSVYLWTFWVLRCHLVAIFRGAAVSVRSRWELLLPRGPASPLLSFPGLKLSTFSRSLFCYLWLSRPELTVGSRRVRLSEAAVSFY